MKSKDSIEVRSSSSPYGAPEVTRRRFLVSASQIAVVSAWGLACKDPTAVSGPSGSVRITIGGLTGSAVGSLGVLDDEGAPYQIPGLVLPAPDGIGVSTLDIPNVPIGTYTLVYQAPANHEVVDPPESSGVHARTVVVTDGGLATASFLVELVSTPVAGLIFASDFATAVGTSDSALRDTGKSSPWNIVGGTGLEVIASTPALDFPTTNVLRVTALSATNGYARLFRNGLAPVAIGNSRYYRFYFRATFPDGVDDDQSHPIEDGNARNWAFSILHNLGGNGFYTPYIGVDGGANGSNYRWYLPALQKAVTYRFEVQIHRLTAAGFNLHVRAYAPNNPTPVVTDADVLNEPRNTALSASPTLLFGDASRLADFWAGLNGLAGTNWHPSTVYGYQGGFAVSDSDWCGPYVPGEQIPASP